MLKRVIQFFVIVVAAAILSSIAAIAYLRSAPVPICDERVPSANIENRHPIDVSLGLRSLVLHAELDHALNPLPELKAMDCRRIWLRDAEESDSHEQDLTFVPAMSDTFVIYRVSADGKLLCKQYAPGLLNLKASNDAMQRTAGRCAF
jgi:hypothetical protein